jgi:hypothetical protein
VSTSAPLALSCVSMWHGRNVSLFHCANSTSSVCRPANAHSAACTSTRTKLPNDKKNIQGAQPSACSSNSDVYPRGSICADIELTARVALRWLG